MKTYRYKAINTDSYQSLAKFIAPCMDVQATFFPLDKTIVIAFQGEDASEIEAVADHINDNALDFQTSPVEIESVETSELLKQKLNPASLRDLIAREIQYREEMEKACARRYEAAERNLTEAQAERDRFKNYWLESNNKLSALKSKIGAFVTLMEPLAKD